MDFGVVDLQFWGVRKAEPWKLRRYELPFTQHSKIYHYTSIPGLYGIFESKGLWVSNIAYMNDADEILHGRRVGLAVLKRFSEALTDTDFKCLLEEVADRIREDVLPDLYIACFATDGDSLDLWRGYCKGGSGVSIEFDLEQKHHFQILPVFTLQDVVYRKSALARQVLLWLKRAEICFSRDKDQFGRQETLKRYKNDYVEVIIHRLETLFLSVKNEAFSSEREVRLIYRPKEKDGVIKKYRSNPRFIIPYYISSHIYGDQTPEPLPVTKITVGPSQYSELTAKSIFSFVRSQGCTAPVLTSSVPYREY